MTPSNLARCIELRKIILDATAEINNLLNPKPQWEPCGGTWYVDTPGMRPFHTPSHESSRINGFEYQTKEQAVFAIDHMRKFNRLLAYIAEFDVKPSDELVSSADLVNFEVKVGDTRIFNFSVGKRCADELSHKLNSGEVIL